MMRMEFEMVSDTASEVPDTVLYIYFFVYSIFFIIGTLMTRMEFEMVSDTAEATKPITWFRV